MWQHNEARAGRIKRQNDRGVPDGKVWFVCFVEWESECLFDLVASFYVVKMVQILSVKFSKGGLSRNWTARASASDLQPCDLAKDSRTSTKTPIEV